MRLFARHHLLHFIRLGPHALADLRSTRQAAADADVDIPVFVRGNPVLLFDSLLRQYRTRMHTRVNLIARSIQESCVDKYDTVFCCTDAGWKVNSRASFLIHYADF